MKQIYRFIISGKVQGVGYRRFVQKFCLTKKYDGWVRNLDNGSVEAWIGAEDLEFSEIEQQLKKGPLFSKVIEIQKTKMENGAQALGPFEIRKDGLKIWKN